MKIVILITFSVFLNFEASAQKCSCDSICFCETLINNLKTNSLNNYSSSSRLFTSKVHQFENLPEPRNATEGIYYISYLTFIVNYLKVY